MTTGILIIAALAILLVSAIVAFMMMRHNTVFPLSLDSLNTADLNHGISYETELEGNPVFIRFHDKVEGRYGHHHDHTQPRLKLWMPCPLNGEFRITRENKGDIAAKKMGLCKELQTGDAAFDALAYIHTHSREMMENYLVSPETRQLITELFDNGFTEFSHNGSELCVETQNFSTGNFADKNFIPDNLTRLLVLSRKLAIASPGRNAGGLFVWKAARRLLILLTWLVLAAGLGLMFYAINTFNPLDPWEFFKTTFPFALAVIFIYLSFCLMLFKGRSAAHRDLGHIGLVSLLGFPPLVFGLALFANGQLDSSPTLAHDMLILDKNIRHSKNSTTYYVTVKSWRPLDEVERLQIGKDVYQTLQAKSDHMIISTRKGFLDYEWLIDMEPVIYSQ